ncbi:MAG TPA: ABC transporter substrate-binding protein [Streptosporangiaceae bacterium]|nr:ABC transporter substrate-binding protein [Streptosporangiaceae bacterium]
MTPYLPLRRPSLCRRRRSAAGAALATVLALAGCGSAAGSAVTVSKPTGRVLNLSFLQDPGSGATDPDIYYAGQGIILQDNIYQGLLQYKPGTATPTIVPDLATSWTVSKNDTVYTFKLHHGVLFHDGTPFTSAAVEPSFKRRLAVGQGPAYMVEGASVTTQGPYQVTITLKSPNPNFPAYLASAYGPRMMSPTGLAAHAGSDNDQTYLRTHDLGTGPYELTEANVGSMYQMKAFPRYWGPKPYFTTVNLPVIDDSASQQIEFNKGGLAAILHDLPEPAVRSYLADKAVSSYSLPTLESQYFYVNPDAGFLTTAAHRIALLEAINVRQIYDEGFTGRATIADQAYPAHMMSPGKAVQDIPYRTGPLSALAKSLPANERSITIGYDSSSPDGQLIANIVAAQLDQAGLSAQVDSYTTAQIYGWAPPAPTAAGAPDVLIDSGWPDAAPPYMWAHISFDPNGGLNYLHCSTPQISKLIQQGQPTGSLATFSTLGELSVQTGCWYNLVNQNDFMVAQPWLKGVAQAHVVTYPYSLDLADLYVG